ncbi:MAG: hypothetical protein ACKVWR_19785 [Acidimicrobiales bacterium]
MSRKLSAPKNRTREVAHLAAAKLRPGLGVSGHLRRLPGLLDPGDRLLTMGGGRAGKGIAVVAVTDRRILILSRRRLEWSAIDLGYTRVNGVSFFRRLGGVTLRIAASGGPLDLDGMTVREALDVAAHIQAQLDSVIDLRRP